ncbi:MAG: T9SS type A sorting domain-containing protein [Candidatus Cloacimonetes bacterium]|nr:T9SS type A sorting domain-containing protein [Candidatus Cloacimonadota bacterium]
MKTKITILFFLVLLSYALNAQLQWQTGGMPVNVDYPLYWYDESGAVVDEISYYVWSESQTGDPDLYMQAYNVNGVAIWQSDLLICEAAKYQGRSQVIAASDGNLIVGWHDTRNIPGLYFGDGYEIYLQKVSPAGEILWGANGVCVSDCYPYTYRLISDDQGGCYLSFRCGDGNGNYINFWHYNSEGVCCPNWETGISLDVEFYDYEMITDGNGNLVIYYPEESVNKLTKLSPLGEFIWEGIIITDYYASKTYLFQQGDTLDMIFRVSNEIFLQKIDLTGSAVFDEPLLLLSSPIYISSFIVTSSIDSYYIYFYQYDTGNTVIKIDSAGEELWSNYLNSDYSYSGIYGMGNGNFRLWRRGSITVTLWEYDSDGELYSPEEGWWDYESETNTWGCMFGVFSGGNITSCGWRLMNDDPENEILTCQIINESGQAVCGEEGSEISRGRNSSLFCENVYKVNDLEAVFLESYYLNERRMVMKLFNEDGNVVGASAGMQISSPEADYSQTLGVIEERIYFVMEVPDPETSGPEFLYLNAVDFSVEPELVWGEDGIFLGEGEFINTNINMTTIPDEDNALLFTWNLDSPHGYARVQKMVNDEFVWEEGGIIYPWANSDTHWIVAYHDYIFRMTSWGSGYFLSRVDENGEMMWDEEVPFNITAMADYPTGIPQTDGNMLFLVAEHTTFGMQLLEYRITPEGENLSSDMGDIVSFLQEADELTITDLGDSYAIFTRQDDDNMKFRRFNYDGTALNHPVDIPGYEYYDIDDVRILNEHLLIFSHLQWGAQQITVVDFEGIASELLPQNPYQYLEYSNYWLGSFTCIDGDDIYFCWIDGKASERPDEGEYGMSWYMQKLRIPTTVTSEDEIQSTIKLQLSPNPFNPDLKISWDTINMKEEKVKVAVYNVKGQQIRTWQTDSARDNITWDGKNQRGLSCSTGIYFVRIISGRKSVSNKAVLLK